jgi:uncharacterized repeat protein (TIGR01451 family)
LVPWLLVSIDTGGDEGEYGKPLSYTFHYTNTDAARAATNVVISTTIPTGTSFVAESSDAWSCSQVTAGGVCAITLANIPANTSGSFVFTVLLSTEKSDIPSGGLDIFANVTQGTVARTEVVTLAGGESNLTIDAGIVALNASFTAGTPTDPTNLPDGEQPKQVQQMYLPTLHQDQ